MINAFSNISARQSYQQTGGGGGGDGTNLLEWSDLTYEGSFRVPYSYPSNQVADYGGHGGMWYHATNSSLWLTGNVQGTSYFEISIPTLVDISAAAISTANTGTLQQSYGLNLNNVPNQTLTNIRTGAICIDSGNFYGGLYIYYDGSASAQDAWFKIDSATLSGANITGLFQVSDRPPAYTARYAMDIPAAKQSKLGGFTHACGTIAGPIIGRYSVGPTFIAFNPSDIGVSDPTDSGDYLYRSLNDGLAVGYDYVTHIGGGFIPDGTNCVMFFGDKASTGVTVGYGEAAELNDGRRGGKGYHAQDGDYTYCWWAYDLDDLESVKNGEVSAASVAPYAYGDIDLPKNVGPIQIGGVAYDRTGKRIFISTIETDIVGFARLPLIHVYSHN